MALGGTKILECIQNGVKQYGHRFPVAGWFRCSLRSS